MEYVLSSDELHMIINSLDFYSRIWMGQYDTIMYDIRWCKNCDELDKLEREFIANFLKIRHILLPKLDQLDWSGSFGIFNPELDYRAGVAYDIQQVFRHNLAYFLHPEGGWTVDFRSVMFCDSDPYPSPKAECYKEDDEIKVKITICEEQLSIIKSAILAYNYMQNGLIDEMFRIYTDNEDALKIASIITEMLESVANDDICVPNNKKELLNKLC